jgi:hypothetical protein
MLGALCVPNASKLPSVSRMHHAWGLATSRVPRRPARPTGARSLRPPETPLHRHGITEGVGTTFRTPSAGNAGITEGPGTSFRTPSPGTCTDHRGAGTFSGALARKVRDPRGAGTARFPGAPRSQRRDRTHSRTGKAEIRPFRPVLSCAFPNAFCRVLAPIARPERAPESVRLTMGRVTCYLSRYRSTTFIRDEPPCMRRVARMAGQEPCD